MPLAAARLHSLTGERWHRIRLSDREWEYCGRCGLGRLSWRFQKSGKGLAIYGFRIGVAAAAGSIADAASCQPLNIVSLRNIPLQPLQAKKAVS